MIGRILRFAKGTISFSAENGSTDCTLRKRRACAFRYIGDGNRYISTLSVKGIFPDRRARAGVWRNSEKRAGKGPSAYFTAA